MLFTREETGTTLLSQWRRTGLHCRVYFDYKGHRLIKSATFVKVDISLFGNVDATLGMR